MALQDVIKDLQEFDVNDLSLESIGSWPLAVKIIILVLVFVAVLALGYFQDISGLQQQQAAAEAMELRLREEFKTKSFKAANLDAYRKQMVEMEESFGALISQLPSDTEVPGLLEDLTNRGVSSGLEISSITLQAEQAAEFYVELPIKVNVRGSYHDIGSFVSGIASLPRIVTLHDFKIKQDVESQRLDMEITAKTYRYRDMDEEANKGA